MPDKRTSFEPESWFQSEETEEERNQRLLGVQNVYGTNTRSYNKSSEKKEMDRQRQEVDEEYTFSRPD